MGRRLVVILVSGFLSVVTPFIHPPASHFLSDAYIPSPSSFPPLLSSSSSSSSRSSNSLAMIKQPQETDCTRPWLDAWTLLLKEIRPNKPPGPPKGFLEIVREDERGRRSIAPAAIDADTRILIRSLWRHLSLELGHISASERSKIKLALELATLAHKGQSRKSGAPFIEHPVEVARILAELNMDVDTIVAGLLHDTVEDTYLRLEEIEQIFGESVKNIVEGETKVSKLAKLGSSPIDYEETQAENLRSLFLAMTNDYRVIFVKLADRLHNMRTLEWMSPHKQVKISRETLDIYAPLADRLGIRGLKSELEDIAFQYVYPAEYQEITNKLAVRSEGYEKILTGAYKALDQMLERKLFDQPTPLNLTVSGRLKEKYSLWRKMERKRIDEQRSITLDDIHDVVAMRIIINIDREADEPESEWKGRGLYLCYRIMYLCLRYLSAPGYKTTVEDYVAQPKPNGYQSLHASIFRNGQVMEVQIRTDWMHQIAEHGLAAHWLYKDEQQQGRTSRSYYQTAWLTCVKDWKEEGLSSKDFVEAVRAEILGRRVSFFLKNGRIHDLPRGSTVLDAAFKLHKQIGLHLRLAEVNGLPSSMEHEVQNGDVLFVVSTRNAKPSPEWSLAAQCRTTRGKIRSFFRTKEPQVAEAEGQRLVWNLLETNRALLEVELWAMPTVADLKKGVREYTGHASLAELYFQVALSVESAETAAIISRVLRLSPQVSHALNLSPLSRESRIRGPRGEQESTLILSTDGRETYKMCPSCHPCDGDPLIGIKTWGRGEVVIVHRADVQCPQEEENRTDSVHHRQPVNAARFNLDEDDAHFPVPMTVIADRQRLYVLSNLVSALESYEALLLDAALGASERDANGGEIGPLKIELLIGVRDLAHLRRVIQGVQSMEEVIKVYRTKDGMMELLPEEEAEIEEEESFLIKH